MSLSAAMNAALTGLTSNIRAAGLISNNIANADTDGYATRSLDLSAVNVEPAGGVVVNGILRHQDQYLLADRRVAEAKLSYSEDIQDFYTSLETEVGGVDATDSITVLLTAFETALATASANPSQDVRLESISYAANDLTEKFNDASSEIQELRERADADINTLVEELNDNLQEVKEINVQIIKLNARKIDTSALQDQRQALIDEISSSIPISTDLQDNGVMYVYSTTGLTLVEKNASVFEFSESAIIQSDMNVEDGNLSGITLNDIELNSSSSGVLGFGQLGALFEIRDEISVEEQAQLDGIARDLVERFDENGADSTILSGDPGLFTDSGAAFSASDEIGLSGRLELNSLVSPGSDEYWRLRDGLGASTQGDVGDATLINSYTDQLTEEIDPGSVELPDLERSFISHIEVFSSSISTSRVRAENEFSYNSARLVTTQEAELSEGVDTDQQLQLLIRVEQQYAANAQVMSVIDELMERLVNIF